MADPTELKGHPYRTRNELGRRAEADAWAAFEGQPGARVLVRNYRLYLGEIDLIAQDGADLVFIEVRRRSLGGWVQALDTVDLRKRARIERCARHYLAYVGAPKGVKGIRFDLLVTDGLTWRHVKRAWH